MQGKYAVKCVGNSFKLVLTGMVQLDSVALQKYPIYI